MKRNLMDELKEGLDALTENKRVEKEYRIDYQIEVQNRIEKNWYVRRYGLESIEEARRYLKEHNSYMPEPMRIVKCEITRVTTIIEYDKNEAQSYNELKEGLDALADERNMTLEEFRQEQLDK